DEQAETRPLRSKEQAEDYRYFPDPDLPPLLVDDALIARERAALGELPLARRARYRRTLGLPDYDVSVLTHDRALGDYFEAGARAWGDAKTASNWVMTDVLQALRERHLEPGALPLPPEQLGRLLAIVARGEITLPSARQAFRRMLDRGEAAD